MEKQIVEFERSTDSAASKKSNPWKIWAIIAFCLVGLILIYIAANGRDHKASKGSEFVAVIDVNGEMTTSSSAFPGTDSEYNHTFLIDTIDSLIENKSNKGLFIRVNTPGGEVMAADELYLKIMEYKKETKRPVYAYYGSMAASGGYYATAGADKIIANRNCWTGSIGVTTGTMFNFANLLEKYGVETETITSGANKSMGSPYENMTDEQRAIFQSLIDDAYDQFVGIVAEGRGMSDAKVRKIADGRIYTAAQAKNNGLIDGISSEEEAKDTMKKEEKLKDIEFSEFAPEIEGTSIFDLLTGSVISKKSEIDKLIDLAANGYVFTVSYMANISK